MISDLAHYSMLVLYGLISYGIICSPAMPIILSLWTNTLLFIFMTSLLLAIWSIIICHMKTGVYLKWTLWEKFGSPLLTFEIEPTRHWSSWDEKWDEDEQVEPDSPETIDGWDQALAWGQISNFDNDQPIVADWDAAEWENLEQNPLWLEAGIAVPDSVIMALSVIDHFREETPACLNLRVPPITLQPAPEETTPLDAEIEPEPENPLPENEPIPSFQPEWPLDDNSHTESDS